MAEVKPTYGNFKVRGRVQGLSRDNAYVQDTSKSGFTYRRISFMVHTSEDNAIPVQLFGGKFDKVTVQPTDPEKRKNKKNRKQVPYKEDIDQTLPDTQEVFMGVNVGLEQTENGDNIKHNKFAYDAVKYIHENLNDGDNVLITGGIEYRKFETKDGEERTQYNFVIRNIYKSKSDSKEELASFDQTIIIQEGELDKEAKRANIFTYIVADKEGTLVPQLFYVDGTKLGKFAKTLAKLPFGTEIKVAGNIHNRAEQVEVEADEWGEAPEGYGNTHRVKSLEITKGYSDTLLEGKFTEEDLFPAVEENPFISDDDLPENMQGGKDEGWDEDPFSDSDEDPFESDDF